MKVYNPDKPDQYGIKFYIVAEAKTGYVLDFILYSGVSSSIINIIDTVQPLL